MAFNSYNNNDRTPTCLTYSAISFSNPESSIGQTKINISYYNKLMKISIAYRNNSGSNDGYATYDNDNAVKVYVSNNKARILYLLIQKLINEPDTHNVFIELKNGVAIKVSDGTEYGVNSPCISILNANDDGSVHEAIYQTKANFHKGAVNFSNNSCQQVYFDDIELDTFAMALDEYYKASSYAIAASVWESNMYRHEYEINLIKSIAGKSGSGSNSSKFNNKTFLDNNNTQQSSSVSSGSMIPKEYESSTFEDIANSMMY